MPLRLGLSIGESFAELVGRDGSPATRWYLPRRSLSDGLRDALGDRASEGGQIRVGTQVGAFALEKRFGAVPAMLVTTGFEHWLTLNAPTTSRLSSRPPARWPLPLSEDLIFGMSERIRTDGTIETPVSDEDLLFLASKLEMLKVKTIAVGLLHSDRNPAHEQKIAEFLLQRGYQVFCSSDGQGDERERWRRAAFDAYTWSAIRDQREEIETSLGEHRDKWTIHFVEASVDGPCLVDNGGYRTRFGLAEALAGVFAKSKPVLHLGVERFLLLESDRAPFVDPDPIFPRIDSVRHRRLQVQPSSPIEVDFWPAPVVGRAPRGFEPGPMAFGKALQPTVFDIFFVLERLESIEALTGLTQEKNRARVLESLLTLSKAIASPRTVDPRVLALDLEALIIERIHQDLLSCPDAREFCLTGALARTLHPGLERRRPDLQFRLLNEAPWAEGIAIRDLSVEPSGVGA